MNVADLEDGFKLKNDLAKIFHTLTIYFVDEILILLLICCERNDCHSRNELLINVNAIIAILHFNCKSPLMRNTLCTL